MKSISSDSIIIDADYRIDEIFTEKKIPEDIQSSLKLISVKYYSFDGKLHQGQILIHKDLAEDIVEIFEIIKQNRFPIAKVIPINKYNWSDELSTSDNNSSAFNYRFVKGTKKFSAHSFGRAIDINPVQNPHIKINKLNSSKRAYNPDAKGTITSNSFVVREFLKRGWKWGGNWKSSKDYQHFEKLK
ncbi:MAG: M15 family metallopeptidase [Ignavibacteriaceae bacterium]|nr:M15 family metallopeptidase [Ignavibacteriaceae bacterium]